MSEKNKVRMYKLKNGNSIGCENIDGGIVIIGQSLNGLATVTTQINFTTEAAETLADLITQRLKEKSDEEIDKHNAEALKRMNELTKILKNAFGGQFADVQIVGVPLEPKTNNKKKCSCK